MIDDKQLREISKALQDMGYWYPPDGIQAVLEDRTAYHALNPLRTYEVRPAMRTNILTAIERLERPGYRDALNAEDTLNLVLTAPAEPKKRRHKPSAKR